MSGVGQSGASPSRVVDVIQIARCREHGLHGRRDACFVCGGPVEQMQMVPMSKFIRLYDAAMRVVMIWDTLGSQHHSMPELREALGLPGPRPTEKEAAERMKAWMAELVNRGGD